MLAKFHFFHKKSMLSRAGGSRNFDFFPPRRYNRGMEERNSRTALLLGEAGVQKLQAAHVAVFGLGGVGSWCAEALARAGVGALTLVDKDRVEPSNCNRQLVALTSTVGREKAEVMAERVRDISPACRVTPRAVFYLPETAESLPLDGFSFVADCIDNVTAKLHLVAAARAAGVPVISAMGAGNKLDGSRMRIADLAQTSVCPLARVMRRELKKRGVEHLPVVCSDEPPVACGGQVGSVPFVPSVMGLLMAQYIVKELIK